MPTMTASTAKKRFPKLVDDVAEGHVGYCIVGKRHHVVLISLDDWNAIQETIYLNSFPGLADSIVQGLDTPVSECATELKW